jgi:threonine/homoserine/homoserine lactone efflux protein
MIVAGLLALVVLGPVSFAVLSLRSTPESSGATAGAWITVGIVLALVVAGAAAAGGALVALVRRGLGRGRPSN